MDREFRAKTLQDAIREVIRSHASMQGRTTKSLGEAMGLSERKAGDLLKGNYHMTWWHLGVLTKELGIKWRVIGEVDEDAATQR